jgi:hypothetical protein
MAKATPKLDEAQRALKAAHDEIATEAKKTFSLKDRIAGAKYGTSKVPLILDIEAAKKHSDLNLQSKQMKAMYDASVERKDSAEEIEHHLQRFNEIDNVREAALETLLESMLSAHLTGVPGAVLDRGTRRARTYLGIKSGDTLDDDKRTAYDEEIAFQNFQTTLVKIVDAQGNIAELGNENELRNFFQALPPTQRFQLNEKVRELLFMDAVGRSAVDDPGF